MSLPTPHLDDRRFQDIVDQCKRLIPRYCPEWTDHNVSDPGVALIELFSWMTDMLLYRVNQVPDKMYVTFLEMLGVKLSPPRSAQAAITFYLSAAQPLELRIPAGTEVATVRTETSPAIVFTTEYDLKITPPQLIGAFTRSASKDSSFEPMDLQGLGLPGTRLPIFPKSLSPEDALWFAFDSDLSHAVLALDLEVVTAGGAGIDPKNPPVAWEVWQGGVQRWAACEVEFDGTGGFNMSGEIVLHLPAMERGALEGRNAFWLRCRLTREQKGVGAYRRSPELQGFKLESRGGTVSARHAITVQDELLGRSEGLPGERYKLMHSPVLSRSGDDRLIVETPGLEGTNQSWVEVHDFASSEANDLHYTLEDLSGLITFGPTVLQPDGSAYRFGAIPAKDSNIRMARYQYGGGVIGNLPARALSVLKTAVPYVARVTNRQASVGGRDAQTLEDAKLRAPELLRSRTRAVTVDDYEFLARSVEGVARVHCQGPSAIGEPGSPKPGEVFVTVLPRIEEPEGRIAPDALVLSADVLSRIIAHLEERRLLGTTLKVRQAQLIWLSVTARVRVRDGSPAEMLTDTQTRAEAALYAYLNPYVGGPDGTGWEFGRDLHQAEVVGVLQRLEGVEFVDEVVVSLSEPGSSAKSTAAPNRLALPPHAVVCSDRHLVTVR